MDRPTDYRFNLCKILNLLEQPQSQTTDFQSELPLYLTKPLLMMKLSIQQMIFLRRGMLQASCLSEIIKQLNEIRLGGYVFFLRLSTGSAKNIVIDWQSNNVVEILKQFVSSERIQNDLDEACTRKKALSIIALPWISFGNEYRSFVKDNVYEVTRSVDGSVVLNKSFKTLAEHFTRLLLCKHPKTDPTINYVFDMGYDINEKKLRFISMNQYDDTTNLYTTSC